MPLTLDLSTAKTCSVASFLIALLFAYGAVTTPNIWLVIFTLLFTGIGIWLHREEVKIREHEADIALERAQVEKEKTLESERLKTVREEKKAQERRERDARKAAQKRMEQDEKNRGKLFGWFLDKL